MCVNHITNFKSCMNQIQSATGSTLGKWYNILVSDKLITCLHKYPINSLSQFFEVVKEILSGFFYVTIPFCIFNFSILYFIYYYIRKGYNGDKANFKNILFSFISYNFLNYIFKDVYSIGYDLINFIIHKNNLILELGFIIVLALTIFVLKLCIYKEIIKIIGNFIKFLIEKKERVE